MKGDVGFPIRLRFAKRGPVRFISHRDVARAFERAFRVVQLPLAFSLGFNPHPKVGFGLALSVGHESRAEYLDVELTRDPELAGDFALGGLPATLSAALPDGIDVDGVAALAERAPSLQESVTAVGYRVEVSNDAPRPTEEAVVAAVTAAMARPTLEVARTRKGREVVEDIRPAIREMRVLEASVASLVLDLELSTQPRGTRPSEVLAALNAVSGGSAVALTERRALRTHQWIERGGARLEPLEAHPRARVPEARAS